jgi:hypothetical protein
MELVDAQAAPQQNLFRDDSSSWRAKTNNRVFVQLALPAESGR